MMECAGFQQVRQRFFSNRAVGPLSGDEALFWQEWLPYLAALALERGAPEADLRTWREVSLPALAEGLVSRLVCVGSIPPRPVVMRRHRVRWTQFSDSY